MVLTDAVSSNDRLLRVSSQSPAGAGSTDSDYVPIIIIIINNSYEALFSNQS